MPTYADMIRKHNAALGIQIQPGIAAAYPEIRGEESALIQRVAALPWVPRSWLSAVGDARDEERVMNGAGGFVGLRRATHRITGAILPNVPAWLDSAEKRQAWDQMAEVYNRAIEAIGARRVEEGRAIIAAAERDAALWNRLAAIAETVRDLPGRAASAVSDGILSVLKGAWPALAAVLGLGLVVAIIFAIARKKSDV